MPTVSEKVMRAYLVHLGKARTRIRKALAAKRWRDVFDASNDAIGFASEIRDGAWERVQEADDE